MKGLAGALRDAELALIEGVAGAEVGVTLRTGFPLSEKTTWSLPMPRAAALGAGSGGAGRGLGRRPGQGGSGPSGELAVAWVSLEAETAGVCLAARAADVADRLGVGGEGRGLGDTEVP